MPRTAPDYKDLDEMRLEWFICHTDMPVRDIADKLGRSEGSVYKKMYNMGLSIAVDRYGRAAWSGR